MTTLTRPGGFARQRIDTAVHAVANEETRAACRASWSSTQQHCGPGGQIRTGREWNARVNACTVTDGHDYKETRHGHADMTTAPPSCGPDSTCRECSEQRTPRRMPPETYSHRHSGRVLWTVHCPDRRRRTGTFSGDDIQAKSAATVTASYCCRRSPPNSRRRLRPRRLRDPRRGRSILPLATLGCLP